MLSEIKVARWLLPPLTLKIFTLLTPREDTILIPYIYIRRKVTFFLSFYRDRMSQRKVITAVSHIFVLQARTEESSLYERETVTESERETPEE